MKGTTMTTLAIARMRFNGDAQEFQRRYTSDPEIRAIFEELGQPEGAIRHRTFATDGELIVVDEWESAEQVRAWIGSPGIQRLMSALELGRPEVTIAEQLVLGDELS